MRKHSDSAMLVGAAAVVKISVLAILVTWLVSCFPVIGQGYYKPSAALGQVKRFAPACGGPKRVIRFPVNGDSNVAVRLQTFQQGTPSQPEIEVDIEATYFDHKKGKPPSHVFSASGSQIVVYWGHGQKRVFPSVLSLKDRVLDSEYGYSTLAILKLSEWRLSNFTVEIPPVFFDGHKLEIPQVHFEYKTTSYISAINC